MQTTETLCDVHGILKAAQCSHDLSTGVLAKIGKKAAELHMTKYGRRPDKQPGEVYGKTYDVYHYPENDRWMVYRSAAVVLTADFVEGGGHHPHILRDRLQKLQASCQRWPKTAAVIGKLLGAVDRKDADHRVPKPYGSRIRQFHDFSDKHPKLLNLLFDRVLGNVDHLSPRGTIPREYRYG